MELKDGNLYIVKEKRNEKSFKHFEELLKNNYKGLIFTRTYPKDVAKNHKIENAMIVWFSYLTEDICIVPDGKESCVNPTNIGGIMGIIRDFLYNKDKNVLLIDGVEYLIFQNNFSTVSKFLQLVNEQITIANAIAIVPLSPELVNEKEFAMISKGAELIE